MTAAPELTAADPAEPLLEALAVLVAECGRGAAYDARTILGLDDYPNYPAPADVLPRLRAALRP